MYNRGDGVARDNVEALKWWNLAANQDNEIAISARAELSGNMTEAQIAEAEQRARDWRPDDASVTVASAEAGQDFAGLSKRRLCRGVASDSAPGRARPRRSAI
jgi:TPR repeat protein